MWRRSTPTSGVADRRLPSSSASSRARYAAIGGTSPLTARTRGQLAALGAALERRAPGRYRTYYGAKHAAPKIEAAIDEAARDGAAGVIGLVLAPHYSVLSVGEYLGRAAAAAAAAGLPAAFLERYGADPVLVTLLAERVGAAIEALPPTSGGR